MAERPPSGTGLPQNQNEELNEAEPVFLQNQENEGEEEGHVPSEDDGDHMSVGELVSDGDEEDDNEDEEVEAEEEDESWSSGEEGDSEGNEWSAAQIDGLFCPICIQPWTTDGDHYICCLPCGHVYGMSCIQTWFERFQNRGKCPQCKKRCTLKNVRRLFASRVVAIDDEAQKRIQSLESKCASLEIKRIVWNQKEAEWKKIEAELRSEVQQLKEAIVKKTLSSQGTSSRNANRQLKECQKILDLMDIDTDLNVRALNVMVNSPDWCELFLLMKDKRRMSFLENVVTRPPNDSTQLMECQKILDSMDIDIDLYFRALDVMVNKPNWCGLFLSMDDEKRMGFLSNVATPPPPRN